MQSCEQFFAVAWDKIRSVAHVEVNRPGRLLLCFQAKYTNKYSAQCNLVAVEGETAVNTFLSFLSQNGFDQYLFIYGKKTLKNMYIAVWRIYMYTETWY